MKCGTLDITLMKYGFKIKIIKNISCMNKDFKRQSNY